MSPRTLVCEVCGERAIVIAYLPIDEQHKQPGQAAPGSKLEDMICVIDCPKCGVRNQVVQAATDN